ncbi:replication factor C large subunit [Haloterrigena sp. SYSU A558-1]|uniref:Replication factor C large subunit n=1 Tax=Haloterrigena gelatinilytica TaxID=2741724 RepID=A0A8J8GN50_9EURY|nr:replication factor C large subunit [Haloterrigena gelatinilytica]NUB92205.1 replication factor C large subunit [Haloterrigena gelatinilytica]NUC71965.1 replication factor C large subunit [Haloterrigena gelatinilytica]
MTDWTEKYRPTTLSEVRGNNKARDKLEEWAESWDDHRDAVIVHGSPGVGKTSAAHALAGDMGWPVMELNASDSRGADVIERVAGEASKSGTLTGGEAGRRLVILDEADNFHGNADYGGSAEVTRVVKDANQPIVLVANEFYDMSQSLRNSCETIEFRDVSKRSIVPVLRDICRREDIEFEEEALEKIAEDTSGDLRSAVNDLQAVAEEAERLTVEDVVTGQRDTTEGIFDFLDALIKEEDAEGALRASYDVDENPDEMLNWIEDNVPKDYAGAELADAYEFLANADRWLGRVRATQNYSYWRYATDNMTAGVAASRREPKGGWTRYGPPSYWSKLGRTKGTRNTRDAIAERIAEREGTSVGTARREILPFLSAMTHHCKNRDLTVRMAAVYELDEKEVSFVTGSGKDTNKVESIVEEAEERRAEETVEHSGSAFFEPEDAGDADGEGDPDAADSSDEADGQETLAAAGSADEANEATEPVADATDADGDEDPDTDDDQSGLSDFL